VLVDGKGKRPNQLAGLTDTMKRAVFVGDEYKQGDFVLVEVTDASQNALMCKPIKNMGVQEYCDRFGKNRMAPL
jgi:tRNA A37 methylthiotransferase MiaB